MAKKPPSSTQQKVAIQEISDSIVILKNGGYRTVLMVNAVNFNLKSEDEQQALVGAYQNFLNGLSFPIQILTQSRTLDLDEYLDSLTGIAQTQSNDLLRTQTNEYITFVRELIGVANIMSKTFYVVIPFDDAPLKSGGLFGFLKGSSGPVSLGRRFDQIKADLLERTTLISSGLASLGLSNIQLNTEELIELFYASYNPDTATRQKLFSVNSVDVSVIRKKTAEPTPNPDGSI